MSILSHPIFSLRSVSCTALAALALAAIPCLPSAQAVTIQVARDIGLDHAKVSPFNFTGRVFDLANVGFGSGTLVRRHTVVTAGHVVFDATTNSFLTEATFTRALYEDYRLSVDQIISASALSGYQADVISSGDDANLTAFRNDQGIVLLHDAPVDENWANFSTTPSLLSSAPGHLFILGYPGESGFDGLTLAVIVPTSPFTAVGTSLSTGEYENDTYQAIAGMSGGPIFYSTSTGAADSSTQYYVTATTVGGLDDSSGEFNQSFVRAIDGTAGKFITDAEYTSGLISKVKITGPTTVSRGQTYTYTTKIVFAVKTDTGAKATTNRYSEVKVKSSTPGTKTLPLVSVKKTSNTTFNVTFSNNIRSGTTTNLQVFYDKMATPLGKSLITVKVQ